MRKARARATRFRSPRELYEMCVYTGGGMREGHKAARERINGREDYMKCPGGGAGVNLTRHSAPQLGCIEPLRRCCEKSNRRSLSLGARARAFMYCHFREKSRHSARCARFSLAFFPFDLDCRASPAWLGYTFQSRKY